MKRKFTTVLLVLLLLLTACDHSSPEPEPSVGAEPTQAVTMPTEPPETKPAVELTAKDIYRKTSLKGNNAWVRSYIREQEFEMASEDSRYAVRYVIRTDMSTDPLRIYQEENAVMDSVSPGMNMSVTHTLRSYTRMESGAPVTYIHSVTYDQWYREAWEGTVSDVMYGHSFFGILSLEVPEGLELDADTQTVDDREAYVLRHTLMGTDVMGAYVGQVETEILYYVDVESYQLLKLETLYHGMEEYLTEMIQQAVGIELTEEEGLFTEFILKETLRGFSQDPVEVPDVPQEGIDSSIDISEIPMEPMDGNYEL